MTDVRPATPARPPARAGGVKDTIKSILIAFILAFIFRAFVVEAFVIPTGSMASTLLGAHMRFHCDDCGHQFDLNFSASQQGDELAVPSTATRRNPTICPNCGYAIPPGQSPVRYGDRILVLKYLYLVSAPQRWDVVVFKSPAKPHLTDYTQNFIKRLVGRPGEKVMILDGDIYAGPHGAPREALTVQTKPRDVQEALWRVVYDNDHPPRGLQRRGSPWRQPWTPVPEQEGWTIAPTVPAARIFRFDNPTGAARLVFDRSAIPATSPLTDWLGYNGTGSEYERFVGDLRLRLNHERLAGEGPLRLRLSKLGQTFVAEIGTSTARLLHVAPDGALRVVVDAAPLPSDSVRRIDFQNVDYRVSLRVNDREVLATTPADYAPPVADLLSGALDAAPPPGAAIEAEAQRCVITHLSLWRDVYYTNRVTQERGPDGTVAPGWATPDNPIELGDDEYFVLGDNSAMSSDARYWGPGDAIHLPAERLAAEPGRVPGRFLLGKAFFVYWPAGYPLLPGLPSLVPNFGDMRFIH